MHQTGFVAIAFPAVALGGPLLLGLTGLIRKRSTPSDSPESAWDWRLTIRSGLIYAIAFNLIFFIQELFLVLPKALTPGLRPTLFHNNHRWEGDHALASLFQGTGALAIFLTGLIFALLVARGAGRSSNLRLFLVWMAYHGLFQSLPQVIVGAMVPGNDVGMAMDYLRLATGAKTAAALVALAIVPLVGIWLTRPLLELAGAGRPFGRAFRIATLPAFAAVPIIILFRVPRELMEVVAPPIAVTLIGTLWIQANAWRVADARPFPGSREGSIRAPLLLLIALLLVFQLVLRPGIAF